MTKALITGITGQESSDRAEFMLDKGYEVHGMIRALTSFFGSRIDHLVQDAHVNIVRLFLHYGDVADSSNLTKLIGRIQPDEVYNLVPQSHV